MRLVPVLDLKGGVVVHARRGARDQYAPLQSPLVDGAEPVNVARALIEAAQTTSLYVADLDAIAGAEPDLKTLRELAEVAELWVDAGARAVSAARTVVGTESLGTDLPKAAVLSVDLRDGRLISPRPELADQEPAAAVPLARELGVRDLLVIDLKRVGSGEGPPLEAVRELAAALPDHEIYAGGGVRDNADLDALANAGAAGALVATALHDGRITRALHRH